MDENVRIVLRVSFNRDGTLASQPWILDASFLPGASALIQAAMSALEKCQPYAELPKDKYNESLPSFRRRANRKYMPAILCTSQKPKRG
jgi:hypothetical protein